MRKYLKQARSFLLSLLPGWRSTEACIRWCEAGQAIDDWEARSKVPLSWSAEGRALVRRYIEAYHEKIRCNPYLGFDAEYVAMWSHHLHPPAEECLFI